MAKPFGKSVHHGRGLTKGLRLTIALWIAAGASPKAIATRARHTSVSVVLDRYGHLLPSSEERVTDALDDLGRAAFDGPRDKRAMVVDLGNASRGA